MGARESRLRWTDHGYLLVAAAIGLAVLADLGLNQARATIFLAQEIFALQDYLQFWR